MEEKDKIKNEKLQVIEEIRQRVENDGEISSEFLKILFPPQKREYELTYYGKESVEKILSEIKPIPLQEDKLFPTNFNSKENEWINKLIFGENSQILQTLIQMKRDGKLKNSDGTYGVRLIYIDPPFATKQEFKISGADQVAYADKVSGAQFIEFLRKRLILAKELLSDDGCIFVHLDGKMCHYIKVIMDEIFGKNNFRNEIIWCYTGPSQTTRYFTQKHDNILFYSKSENYFFNTEKCRIPYKKSTASSGKTSFTGNTPLAKIAELDERGKLVEDWWTDIAGIGYSHSEIVGYPTQKPEKLLIRIIESTTKKGDLVLDFFCGEWDNACCSRKVKSSLDCY